MTAQKTKQRLSPKSIAAVGFTLLVSVLVLWQFGLAVSDGLAWKLASDMAQVAPDYEWQEGDEAKVIGDFTLKDRFGKNVSLSQFAAADLLIINIWSSSCPPCIEEMPLFAEMDHQLAGLGKVALLTITTDEKWDDVAFIFPKGTDLRILFDPQEKVTVGLFGTSKYPETFILDKQRKIRARFDGRRDWHSSLMLEYLKKFK